MKDLPLDSTDLTWLAGLARALLREPHAADDLVQETAMAALEAPLPADAPRRAWLGSVARRLAARRFRGDARRAWREELAARSEELPDSAELVERAEIAEQVTAAARQLPEPFRRTILLRFLEGRTPEEIAREEGKPADTVRWRVRRGLELLREELVRRNDREWSSWSVLLLPLAHSHGDAGLATVGASGVFAKTVASMAAMKVTIGTAVVLGCAGLWFVWDSGDGGVGDLVAPQEQPALETAQASAPPVPRDEAAPSEPTARLPVATATDATAALPAPTEILGQVVDEEGEPVAGATVYLIASSSTDTKQDERVRARTESDWRGAFRFAQRDWQSAGAEDDLALDLGATANGYLREVVPDVLRTRPREELVLVLERGRGLSGRVVDELGRPVPGLELLVHTDNARIAHVSPSQRLLRARRNNLATASSSYEQCRATTDGRGEVVFTGLPAGDLRVLPLDPGWTIEGSRRVEPDGSSVEWTVRRRLGVRLVVVDAYTGQPVERAAATFRFECTFSDGEVLELGQWVGRGAGEASFVLAPELLPGLEERTITRVDFYGTVRAEQGAEVSWAAEPLEDSAGVVGVAEVLVEVEPPPPRVDSGDEGDLVEDPGTATLVLDVRYEDATPFEGELEVTWRSSSDPSNVERDRADATGTGRYRLDTTAGDLSLKVADRDSYGSLPPWSGEVRCPPDRETLVLVTLPRGAAATITRPEGWSGEWFLQSSFRPRGAESWETYVGWSTAESSSTLTVLRPGEWRFELRQDSALEANPLVRTAFLKDGETTLVER